MITSPNPNPQLARERIDASLLGLLPWLASRFDLSTGVFRGEGDELDAPPGLLTAQGRAILHALGIHPYLPHIVRIKLERWPTLTAAALAEPARQSPLARSAQAALSGSTDGFVAALRPYASPDSGYALISDSNSPGSLAAAYHLLVVVRPRWFAARSLSEPVVSDAHVAALNERLLAATAP